MFFKEDIRDVKSTRTYKAGKVVGFGAAMSLFFSVFYLILSFLGKLPVPMEYCQMMSILMVLYAIGLVTVGRRKWEL